MNKIYKIAILTMILCAIMIGQVFAQTGKIVNTDQVRFRAKNSAEEDSEILGNISEGTEVEILDKTTGWYKVNYNAQTGYVNANYIELVESEDSTSSGTTVTQKSSNTTSTDTTENTVNQPNTNATDTEDTNIAGNAITNLNTDVQYVINEKVSLKLMPLITSKVIQTLTKGTTCTVVTTAGKWAYIETTTIKGWILKDKLVESNITNSNTTQTLTNDSSADISKNTTTNGNITTTTTVYSNLKKGYVNLDSINVRKQPDTTGELVAKLTLNTEVSILGEDGDWYLVELNGEKVYIFKELLSDSKVSTTSRSSDYDRTEATNAVASESVSTPTTENVVSTTSLPVDAATGFTGENIVNYAKTFLGYPYVYGNAGPNSFDCSGFTSYVYKHFGYSISRSSSTQQYDGVQVEKQNLQKGDIIIFLNSSKTAVGHVGIYIGNNQFIHASSPNTGVIISDLSSANYPQRYVTARRIIN